MNSRRSLFLVGALCVLLPLFLALDENSFSANQARLASMSPEQLDQLRRNRDKFETLLPEEQDRLRRLDQELHREPNAELLIQTLRGYHEWLKTLRSDERARLKDPRPAAERISEITQLISSRRERDIGLTNETRLPPKDNDALRKWAGDFARRKQAEITKLFPPGERSPQPGSRRGNQPPVYRMVFSVVRGRVPDDNLEELMSADEIAQLAKSLSPKANEILANQKTQVERIRLIFRWIFASFQSRISEEELKQFFEEVLDDKTREFIYRIGPEEGRQELERLYRESRQRRMYPRPPEDDSGRFPDNPPRRDGPGFDSRPPPINGVRPQ